MSRFRNFLSKLLGQPGPADVDAPRTTEESHRDRRREMPPPAPLETDDAPVDRSVPDWVFRALPLNATKNAEAEREVADLCRSLPEGTRPLLVFLTGRETYADFDSTANVAIRFVWQAMDSYLTGTTEDRAALLDFAELALPHDSAAFVVRRLTRDRNQSVRRRAHKLLGRGLFTEVALPANAEAPWDARGWTSRLGTERLRNRAFGAEAQTRRDVPTLETNAELRELLGIRSENQLGFLMLGTDAHGGPYRRFTIPKRNGGERTICAPTETLRFVQRRILDEILAPVAVHSAAHGFVPGRSTVTNAAVHQGAGLLLKFDLTDFFPTIHYFRVAGLFASLGYAVRHGDSFMTTSRDEESSVAATLARLCTWSASTWETAAGFAPQGAPTSPAISNLVCRRLDARLTGLASKSGGQYTRYADDLTFSFPDSDFNIGRFRWWVDQICQQEGFHINYRKFRVLRNSQRQSVTGIVVNDCLRVPREERRRLRAILHNCRKHGVASQTRGRANFRDWLRGYAAYIHMVHPEEGLPLMREVEELLRAERQGEPS